MSQGPGIGDRVEHANEGGGTVVAQLEGGRARVRFDHAPGLPRTLDIAELRFDAPMISASASVADAVVASPAPSAPASAERASLRQAIEALRLGVVPLEHAREYTVARESQLAGVEELLESGHGMRLVWGDYGSGKTHMLDIAEELARSRGYLTARVVLDPVEMPPSHPLALYRAIVEGLGHPDEVARGLEPLFRKLLDSPAHTMAGAQHASRFYTPFLHALKSERHTLLDWMRDYVDGCYMDVDEGNARLKRAGWQGQRLLTMSDYRTYGRMYVHLVGTVASWARDVGYRGLFLLFDEVEFVDSLSKEQLGYAAEVIKHYAAVTLPREQLAFDPEALYRGGQPVHRAIPLRFREDQPLAALCALTPLEFVRGLFEEILVDPAQDLELPPLRKADQLELCDRIEALYLRAYAPWRPDPAALAPLRERLHQLLDSGEGAPRAIVRNAVLGLDALRVA